MPGFTGVGKQLYDSMHRCGETVVCVPVCTGVGKQLYDSMHRCGETVV